MEAKKMETCAAAPKELHIAPMLATSNREFRALFRILSKRATLWTEMVVDSTLFYNLTKNDNSDDNDPLVPPEHLLDPCTPADHPVVCQIGGIRPEWTTVAARAVAAAGYNNGNMINLNLDCPSPRVQGMQFGAVLMQHPDRVVALLRAMVRGAAHGSSDRPVVVSVKCRIGIEDPGGDDDEAPPTDWDWLEQFVQTLSSSSDGACCCTHFVIHARPVRLRGLNPAQNRSVPPLNYSVVYRLCRRFPDCQFWINGGIAGLRAARELVVCGRRRCGDANNNNDDPHAAVPCRACEAPHGSCVAPPAGPPPANLRGAMLGRAAMDDPVQFWDVDRYWYNDKAGNPVHCRRDILDQYCAFLESLYPRRCCDACAHVTSRIPAPAVVHHTRHCTRCDPATAFVGRNRSKSIDGETNNDDHDDDDGDGPKVLSSRKNGASFVVRAPETATNKNGTATAKAAPTLKITSVVMDRSLKPVLGLFFGQAGSKAYRHACDKYSRCPWTRNCGPAFVLRLAVHETISDAVLDQPLVHTEDR